jgi:hypothetical protein
MLNTCFAMLHGVSEDESEIYVREVIDLLTKLLGEYHADEDTPETSKTVEEVPTELCQCLVHVRLKEGQQQEGSSLSWISIWRMIMFHLIQKISMS